MHVNQPLTSVEAFALALVEASSRLSSPMPAVDADEIGTVSDEPLPAAE